MVESCNQSELFEARDDPTRPVRLLHSTTSHQTPPSSSGQHRSLGVTVSSLTCVTSLWTNRTTCPKGRGVRWGRIERTRPEFLPGCLKVPPPAWDAPDPGRV